MSAVVTLETLIYILFLWHRRFKTQWESGGKVVGGAGDLAGGSMQY